MTVTFFRANGTPGAIRTFHNMKHLPRKGETVCFFGEQYRVRHVDSTFDTSRATFVYQVTVMHLGSEGETVLQHGADDEVDVRHNDKVEMCDG